VSARNPIPAEVVIAPASVVIRSPAPRLMGNPGIAVCRVRPSTMRIRIPTDGDARVPNRAQLGIDPPCSVRLQVIDVSTHFRRNPLDALSIGILTVPRIIPGGEIVVGGCVKRKRGLGSSTGLCDASLAASDQNRPFDRSQLRNSFVDRKDSRVAALVCIDPEQTGGSRVDRSRGSVDTEASDLLFRQVQKDATRPNSEDGLSISISKFNKIDARSLIQS